MHRQRPFAFASHNVHRTRPRARLVVLVMTLTFRQRVDVRGRRSLGVSFGRSSLFRGFRDSLLWSSNLGPRQPGELCPYDSVS